MVGVESGFNSVLTPANGVFSMASPQLENGFTPISNELLEALMMVQMSGSEWQYVMCLVRKTYGFRKKEDWVTNTQVVKMTGLRKERVSEAKSRLLERKIVTEKRNKISLNKDYDEWKELRKSVTAVTEKRNFLLRKSVPTKEKKETIQNITAHAVGNLTTKAMPWNKHSDEDFEDDVQIDPDYRPRGKTKKKSVAPELAAVFDLFDNPAKAVWPMRPMERAAAEALLEAYGLEVLERRMKRIKLEREKKDPYFPDVFSPSDLLEKMPRIEKHLGV